MRATHSKSWRYLQLAWLAAILLFVGPANAAEDEAVTMAKFRAAQAALREDSQQVQGEFEIYRSEAPLPKAIEELPNKLGMSLERKGKLWRDKDRFRADFVSYSKSLPATQHSVVNDADKVFEFNASTVFPAGTLREFDAGAAEAKDTLVFIETTFLHPLNALWSSGRGPGFVELSQRPKTSLGALRSKALPGGFALITPGEEGGDVAFEFSDQKKHPFGYLTTSSGSDESAIKLERRVFSGTVGPLVLPSRVVDVVSIGKSTGYTQVVVLNLAPLSADSPLAKKTVAASFEHLRKQPKK